MSKNMKKKRRSRRLHCGQVKVNSNKNYRYSRQTNDWGFYEKISRRPV